MFNSRKRKNLKESYVRHMISIHIETYENKQIKKAFLGLVSSFFLIIFLAFIADASGESGLYFLFISFTLSFFYFIYRYDKVSGDQNDFYKIIQPETIELTLQVLKKHKNEWQGECLYNNKTSSILTNIFSYQEDLDIDYLEKVQRVQLELEEITNKKKTSNSLEQEINKKESLLCNHKARMKELEKEIKALKEKKKMTMVEEWSEIDRVVLNKVETD
jgi:hypothetical protein